MSSNFSIDEGKYCKAWLEKGFCPMQFLGSQEIEVGSSDRVHSHKRNLGCDDIKSISSSSGDLEDETRPCVFKHEYPSSFSDEEVSRHGRLVEVMNEIFDVTPQEMLVEVSADPANSALVQIHMENLINHLSCRRAAAIAAASLTTITEGGDEKRSEEKQQEDSVGVGMRDDFSDFSTYKSSLESLKKALDLLVHHTLEGTDAIKKQRTETKMRCIGNWNNDQQSIQSRTPNNSTESMGERLLAAGASGAIPLSGHDVEQAFYSQRYSSLRDPSLAIPAAPTIEQLPSVPVPAPLSLANPRLSAGVRSRRASSSAISVVSSDSADDEAGSGSGHSSEGGVQL